MSTEVVDAFLRLFRGRGDAYGAWHGECVREAVTPAMFEAHLREGPYFGVYPTMGDKCSWGCVDIDYDDMDLAFLLHDALWGGGVKAHVEKTRRGYHVWVFPDQPLIPAKHMRRCLMAACKVIGYNPKEVNPKQENVPRGSTGNYVRLPYPGALAAPAPIERTFLTRQGWQRSVECLIEVDTEGRADAGEIERLSAFWTPPIPQAAVDFSAGLEAAEIVKKLPPLAYTIWRDGVLEGNDRSGTLAHLVHLMAEAGINPADAYKVACSADQRMGGKFMNRGQPGELLIQRLVEETYGRHSD